MDSQEATQPSTQQVLDPRRLGRNHSGLDDNDIADVLVILHPATPAAIKIVEMAAQTTQEHVLFYHSLDSFDSEPVDIEEQETIIISKSGERVGQAPRAAADLALRMSSARRLKYKHLGFIFGRNQLLSDIVFGQDSGKRISNQHFRIYTNLENILMIEDMSTNGTLVDDVWLKGRDKRFNKERMLTPNSMITIPHPNEAEVVRFLVRIPPHNSHLLRYNQNLEVFVSDCKTGAERDTALQRLQKRALGPSMKWDGGERYNIIGMYDTDSTDPTSKHEQVKSERAPSRLSTSSQPRWMGGFWQPKSSRSGVL